MTPRKATHVLLEELCKKADRPMSANDIAEYTGISRTQIERIERRALQKINDALDELEETVIEQVDVL